MAPQWALLLVLTTLLAALELEQHDPSNGGYSGYSGKGWSLSPGKRRFCCLLAVRLLRIFTTQKGQRCYPQQDLRRTGISWDALGSSCRELCAAVFRGPHKCSPVPFPGAQ